MLGRVALAAIAAAMAGELALRVVFDLGDPPLFDRDPEIEYLYKPSTRYRYRHHDVAFNAYSMRSPDFPAHKADPTELRVMVIGDSIVTGGAKIDQTELATTLLRESLAAELHRPVIVGNIAAGSWGPPNQLAYIKRFGLFDADVVILVLNSGDADDVPGLEPIGAAWPEHRPWLAVQEPARLLLERSAPAVAERLGLIDRGTAPAYEQRVAMVAEAIRGIAGAASAAHARIACVQYLNMAELGTGPMPGHEIIARDLTAAGVPSHQSGAGPDGFQPDLSLFQSDGVHPSASGQRRLAGILKRAILDVFGPQGSENR